MSSHQDLAEFIKSVHLDLRLRCRDIGPNAAWKEHCDNKEKLKKYASAMHELASVHWDRNNGESCEISRIFWVMKQIKWYFYEDGLYYYLNKERKLIEKFSINGHIKSVNSSEVLTLLDVGSCYNPFSKFPELSVTAIDLAPACSDVLKCDFLSVLLGDRLIIESDNVCSQIMKESYDVVVFSLLLEYMPSPRQRFACCSKAAALLKSGGILIILTPDSKHATANSKLLRNWRLALASLGFLLLLSEKLKHLRCLIFVKSYNSDVPQKWLASQNCTLLHEEAIAIPQDSNAYEKPIIEKEICGVTNRESTEGEFDNKVLLEEFSKMFMEDAFC